jgi:hypothetical protein
MKTGAATAEHQNQAASQVDSRCLHMQTMLNAIHNLYL